MRYEREEASEWKQRLIEEAAFGGATTGASTGAAAGDEAAVAAMAAAKAELGVYVGSSPVVLFSFVDCPWCVAAKALLAEELGALGYGYGSGEAEQEERSRVLRVVEIDELGSEGKRLRAALAETTGRTSMPSCYVGGRALGGYTDGDPVSTGLRALAASGELRGLLGASLPSQGGALQGQGGSGASRAAGDGDYGEASTPRGVEAGV